MLSSTFMILYTLHVRTNIHGIYNIICRFIHSCSQAHYMPEETFMINVTLHALFHIHQLNPKLGGLIKLSAHRYPMLKLIPILYTNLNPILTLAPYTQC